MFRLWGKLYKHNKIIRDTVINMDESNQTKDQLTEICLDKICETFDLQHPMWLNDNHKDYPAYGRTAFKQDHFIEQIDFDYLEIEIIEDEKKKRRRA
ncbi:hypothetical protein HZI73_01120 [Vallitalea pronyensis]|uniref:Uncharacterized protein n=1 Tax=Vallitalea pronyensis TaxID=1348613 RepID=A0A8J8SEW8_9FIRM|nr:hypothetical protein [Vallitalea pronyensis]QUI20980.1 hypothetical protein HZI73_01120 [Vallitalea pronyensis]